MGVYSYYARVLNEADDDDKEDDDYTVKTKDTNEVEIGDEDSSNDNEDGESEDDTTSDEKDSNEEDDDTDKDESPDKGDDNDDTSDTDSDDEDNYDIPNMEDSDDDSSSDNPSSDDSDSSSSDASGEELDGEDSDDPDKLSDKELYDSLTDNEKENKNLELKNNYKDIYMTCDDIIDKVNKIPKENDNIEILKRIISTLSDLKSYIEFYLTRNYNNKTYIENDIMFNKYLAILNGVKNVLKDVEKNMDAK